ncbi:MAG TPA: DUF1819 family protein [Leptospiraceae bacterium]|nr:DUF1819 family protein [Leptospiraceae bacterium]
MVTTPLKKYSANLTKNRALIAETIKIFQEYNEGMSFSELEQRVISTGLLSPLSTNRITSILKLGLKPRYFQDVTIANRIKRLTAISYQDFIQLLYLYTARTDALLYDFVIHVYKHRIEEGRSEISKEEVIRFLREAVQNGFIRKAWNPDMQEYMIQGLFQTLVDFGFLKKRTGETRPFIPFNPSDKILLYLAYELHFSGMSDLVILNHSDWGLFLLSKDRVLMNLKKMDFQNHLIFQQAADVLQITWKYKSMDEVIDALLR